MNRLSSPAAADLELLCGLGQHLELRPAALGGRSVREFLIGALLKIRNKRGQLCRLAPNRVQAAFESCATRRNIVLKARQMGLTTWIAARCFIATITRPGTVSVQVAHDQHSAEEMFRIVHRFLEHLPECLVADGGVLATSRANVRQIVFPHLDSEYRVESAADVNAGRGLTINHLHCSEVSRWTGDGDAQLARLAGLRAAVPPRGEIVLESTPNGAGGLFYDEWRRAAETGYTQHFFPWFLEPSYAIGSSDQRVSGSAEKLTDDERELIERHALSWPQIRFRRAIRSSFRQLAAQEFAEDAESCFLASGECVFDVEIIEERLRSLPPATETRDNGRLAIYWPPRKARYIVAVDPAGGGADGDYACAQVIDSRSGLQCAELQGHFPPRELAARVAALAREYGNALVAVERNNHGHAVLAYLTAVERYENLYERNGQLGWLTSSVTRPEMIERFAAALTTQPQLFWSERLLRECRTFIRRADGTPAAAPGAHDDCILALAIALSVRAEVAPAGARAAEYQFETEQACKTKRHLR